MSSIFVGIKTLKPMAVPVYRIQTALGEAAVVSLSDGGSTPLYH